MGSLMLRVVSVTYAAGGGSAAHMLTAPNNPHPQLYAYATLRSVTDSNRVWCLAGQSALEASRRSSPQASSYYSKHKYLLAYCVSRTAAAAVTAQHSSGLGRQPQYVKL